MLVDPSVGKALQRERFVRVQERMLMKLDTGHGSIMHQFRQARRGARPFHVEPWADHHHEAAAERDLARLRRTYRQPDQRSVPDGCRSAAVHLQHRAVSGLRNVFPAGLVRGVRSGDRRLAGIVLASFVGNDVGHITQLCVTPQAKGQGLGYRTVARGDQRAAHAWSATRQPDGHQRKYGGDQALSPLRFSGCAALFVLCLGRLLTLK